MSESQTRVVTSKDDQLVWTGYTEAAVAIGALQQALQHSRADHDKLRGIQARRSQIVEYFAPAAPPEPVADALADIDSQVHQLRRSVTQGLQEIQNRKAYLEAIYSRLAKLIDGKQEPSSLVEKARNTLQEARDACDQAARAYRELSST